MKGKSDAQKPASVQQSQQQNTQYTLIVIVVLSVIWCNAVHTSFYVKKDFINPPLRSKEFIVNTMFGNLFLKQGEYFGFKVINIVSSAIFHRYSSQRYSQPSDVMLLILSVIIFVQVTVWMYGYIAQMLGLESQKSFFKLLLGTANYTKADYFYNDTSVMAVDNIIMIIIYAICSQKQYDKVKVFFSVGCVSLAAHTLALTYAFFNHTLAKMYTIITERDFLCQLYVSAFTYTISEFAQPFKEQPLNLYNAQKTKSKSLIPERKRGVVRVLSLFFIGLSAFVRAYVYTELHTKHEIVYLLTEAFVAPISTAACLFYTASTEILDDI